MKDKKLEETQETTTKQPSEPIQNTDSSSTVPEATENISKLSNKKPNQKPYKQGKRKTSTEKLDLALNLGFLENIPEVGEVKFTNGVSKERGALKPQDDVQYLNSKLINSFTDMKTADQNVSSQREGIQKVLHEHNECGMTEFDGDMHLREDIEEMREKEEWGDKEEGNDDEGEHEEEEEEAEDEGEEEEIPEMTLDEKQAMNESVMVGDIDLLDDLLDLPAATINMTWYGENLLMTAIRNDQEEMAMFLIDNGCDWNFESTRIHISRPSRGVECYRKTCRQMAYEAAMWDVLELIDRLNGNLWPFMKPRNRVVRLKKPLEEKLRERGELEDESEAGNETDSSPENKGDTTAEELRGSSRNRRQSSGSDDIGAISLESNTLTLYDSTEKLECFEPEESTVYVNPHRYKQTKSFFCRSKSSAALMTARNDTGYVQSRNLQRTTSGHTLKTGLSKSPYHIPSSTANWKSTPSLTRVLSPWKDDDPKSLRIMRRRISAAPNTSLTALTIRKSKPMLSISDRKQDLVPEPKTIDSVVRNESTLFQTYKRDLPPHSLNRPMSGVSRNDRHLNQMPVSTGVKFNNNSDFIRPFCKEAWGSYPKTSFRNSQTLAFRPSSETNFRKYDRPLTRVKKNCLSA